MMKNLSARSREEAERLGQKLVEKQFIRPVKSAKSFKDGKGLYQFSSSEDKPVQMLAKIASLRDDHTTIQPSDFELLKLLGAGDFGKVVLARKKGVNTLYAMKIMDKEAIIEEGEMEGLLSEKKILQNDCPFLVHLHFSFQSQKHFYLVMDYIPGGNLASHLKREERFDEKKSSIYNCRTCNCFGLFTFSRSCIQGYETRQYPFGCGGACLLDRFWDV